MSKQTGIPVYRMDDWFSGIYIKPIGVERSAGKAYESSEPHRHDFYYCVLLDKGQMELEVDFKKVRLSEQMLFLSYPGQIHRIVSTRRLERGWFLALDPAMLDEQLKTVLDQFLSELVLVPLSLERSAGFLSLIDHLYTIYNDREQLFGQRIIQSMVAALVYQFASAYLSLEQFSLTKHSFRNIEITKRFRQLLRDQYKLHKPASAFAEQLNMTVGYLNDTVKSVTGFPLTYHIQQELISEAQKLLRYSDRSIKEIACTLGFEDAKYFNRLFSKVTGISPGAFRKRDETPVHV